MEKAPESIIELLPAELSSLKGPDLLQSGFWGKFKEGFGWTAQGFRIRQLGEGGPRESTLLVLLRSLGAGYSLAYVPQGPQWEDDLAGSPSSHLENLSQLLRAHLPKKCIFIRYDPPWGQWGRENFPQPLGPPFRKARLDIQPPDTVILDLEKDDEVLLSEMKPKTRYNVRLAKRKGVRVYKAPTSDLPRWYQLYRETAARDGISLHREEYYAALFQLAETYSEPRPRLHLLFAEAQGTLIAGIILAVFGSRSYYLYGAASNELRNYMATYALQWRAMGLAREEGARSYDLFGIPPRNDPKHPMYGLYRFKTGFGGQIFHRPGSWDFPLRPLLYEAYRGAEALRTWYYKSFRKRRISSRRSRGSAED